MQNDLQLMRQLCRNHQLDGQTGIAQSYLGDVHLFQCFQGHSKTPVMYEQGLILLIQGNKTSYIGDRRFAYSPEQCLLITTPYPMECETVASADKPVLGLRLALDPVQINQLVAQIKEHRGADYFEGEHSFGIDIIQRDARLQRSISGLLEALQSPMESELLGPQRLRELFYLLLTGTHRHVLAQFCQQNHALQRIVRVIGYIQEHCAEKLTIEALAQRAQMSESAFHRAFKRSVDDSPLQYLKKVRLNKAKQLIVHQGLAANAAAFAVGYESAPQFSREFKRYFGLPPSRAGELAYREYA